jgi:hypothetical protein
MYKAPAAQETHVRERKLSMWYAGIDWADEHVRYVT